MMTDILAGAHAAAVYTGLSRRLIYRLTEQGHLPVVKKGRRLFFSRSALEQAFNANGFGKSL